MAKASVQVPTNLVGLFTDLNKCEQSGDFEKAHKICNKILACDKGNLKAKQCKIVCKIQMGQVDDALKEIAKATNADVRPLVTFEKAYCEYKLNRIDDCLLTLATIEEPALREKELKAQALYRKETFGECYETYIDLIRNSSDEYEAERTTNLAAAIACMSLINDPRIDNIPEIQEITFEQHYNKACYLLGAHHFDVAINKLKTSENICKQTLDEEGATEEEIESELNLIRAQVAYAYQSIGNKKEALNIYNQVLKQKPTDSALVSVINNNIVAINQDQNIFDTKKKMKSSVTELAAAKLLNMQKKTILLNNAIVHLQTNQYTACRNQLNEYRQLYPNEETQRLLLIEISLLKKERKFSEAKQRLEQSIAQCSASIEDKLELILVLGQILLEQNDVQSFALLLKRFDALCAHIGIVCTVFGVLCNAQQRTAALDSLQHAISWYKKNQPQNTKNLIVLYREVVNMLSESNQLEQAIDVLEESRRLMPNNPRIISQLIRAYSAVNIDKARKICEELPIIEQVIESIDIGSIENANWSGGNKYIKKMTKANEVDDKAAVKKSRKRKRKTQLPKNYDPNVKPDAERWLPKWQRSTYKKKKNDRKFNVGKGTQGAVGGASDMTETTFKPSSRVVGTSPMPAISRQQRAQKKKKGGRR